eukprot:scaffold4522_cov141-Skeletonema_menzelii.AAC.1
MFMLVWSEGTLEGATMVRDERRIDQRFAFKFLRHALFAGISREMPISNTPTWRPLPTYRPTDLPTTFTARRPRSSIPPTMTKMVSGAVKQ